MKNEEKPVCPFLHSKFFILHSFEPWETTCERLSETALRTDRRAARVSADRQAGAGAGGALEGVAPRGRLSVSQARGAAGADRAATRGPGRLCVDQHRRSRRARRL